MAWYYCLNNQPVGPVDEAGIKKLMAAGTVARNTQVWQDGTASWQPVSATALAAMLPPGPPPLAPDAYAAAPMQKAAPPEPVKQITLFFMLWWIFSAAGVVACFTAIGAILGVPALIAGAVFYFMLLHKLWCTVQDGRAASTPGKAIGFMFIPFFNLYWQFIAVWGLSKDLNRYAREHNIAAPQVNEALALTGCILICCVLIPFAGILAGIAAMIVLIIAVKGMCDTAAAIIQRSNT